MRPAGPVTLVVNMPVTSILDFYLGGGRFCAEKVKEWSFGIVIVEIRRRVHHNAAIDLDVPQLATKNNSVNPMTGR